MKNKELENKDAVSRSPATTCSADGLQENAERKTLEHLAILFLERLDNGGSPQEFELKKKFIADKIREAVEAEREASAAEAEKHEFCREVDRINGDCDCQNIADAIRSRTE